MPLWMMQTVLVLAPLLLGASIAAYWRLRRLMSDSPAPVAVFLQMRWNAPLIVLGGFVLFLEAGRTDGLGKMPQFFGFLLSMEFFYIAFASIRVMMSARGVLMGMRFMPWQRFSGYAWTTERDVVLTAQRRRYRFRVPIQVRAEVDKILDLNILK